MKSQVSQRTKMTAEHQIATTSFFDRCLGDDIECNREDITKLATSNRK